MTDTQSPEFSYAPQPSEWTPVPPPPKPAMSKALIITLAVAALLVAGGIGAAIGAAAAGGGSTTAAAEDPAIAEKAAGAKAAEARRIAENEAAAKAEEEAAAEALAAQEAAAAVPPKASDFTLGIVVLEKACFGSAGCNVTFRIDPKYNGPQDATDLEVTYEVLGGEDSLINTFTIDSQGTASYPSEETLSTPTGAKLTAKVTAVRRDPSNS